MQNPDQKRNKVINNLIKAYTEKGRLSEAIQATELADHNLDFEEICQLINACDEEDQLTDAIRDAMTGTPQEKTDRIVKICIEKNQSAGIIISIPPNPSPEEIETLIGICIENGLLKAAIKTASLAGRDLDNNEINALVGACADNGWINDAVIAAKLARRKLSTDEISRLVTALENNN